jgi:hypothetical protein
MSNENQGCAKDMKEFQVMNYYFFTELNFFNFLFLLLSMKYLLSCCAALMLRAALDLPQLFQEAQSPPRAVRHGIGPTPNPPPLSRGA